LISSIGSQIAATASRDSARRGERKFSVDALAHFVVAVSPGVIAGAALLILPRHRARRVAEPVANIDVCAVAAWYRPPAAAVLQGIIPARFKLRRRHPRLRAPVLTR